MFSSPRPSSGVLRLAGRRKDAGRPGSAWECTRLHARGATACGVKRGVRVRTSTGQAAGARPDALLFIKPMPDLAGREACPVRVQGAEKFTAGTRDLDSLRDTMPKDKSNHLCTNTNLGCTMRFTGPTHPCTGASPSRDVPRAADSAYERRASAVGPGITCRAGLARRNGGGWLLVASRRLVSSRPQRAAILKSPILQKHNGGVASGVRSRGNLFLLQKNVFDGPISERIKKGRNAENLSSRHKTPQYKHKRSRAQSKAQSSRPMSSPSLR
jgi:hypothetical protein